MQAVVLGVAGALGVSGSKLVPKYRRQQHFPVKRRSGQPPNMFMRATQIERKVRRTSADLKKEGLAILKGRHLGFNDQEVTLLRQAIMGRLDWAVNEIAKHTSSEIVLWSADLCHRGSFRWDLKVPALQALEFSFLREGSTFHDVLRHAFGTECFRLTHCGALIAWPCDTSVFGDEPIHQGWHRDHNDEAKLANKYSPFVVSVFVPLVSITSSNGSTEFLPGRQLDFIPGEWQLEFIPMEPLLHACESFGLWPPKPVWSTEGLEAGDIVMYDGRLPHRGLLNTSKGDGLSPYDVRPMLQLTFAVDSWSSELELWGEQPFGK